MSTYNDCVRQVALTINALEGTSAAALQTTYETVPLTDGEFQSTIIPFLGVIDKVLNAEAKIITAAANNSGHPYRASLLTQTSALASGSEIPSVVGSDRIIGVRGAVRDEDGNVLTRGNLTQIRARVLNPGTMFIVDVPLYEIEDNRIYHTATTATIDVVVYTRPDADTLDLTDDILLPDDAAPACISGALMECVRDDEFMAQGARFGGQFDQWVANVVRMGTANAMTMEQAA